MRTCALAIVVALFAACAAPHAKTDALEADGGYLAFARLRIAPAQTKDFEALVVRCVEVAEAAQLPERYDWLCYRESPGRYWLVTFAAERDRFAIPATARPLRSFARCITQHADAAGREELDERLSALEYEVELALVTRRKAAWSNGRAMTSEEFSRARFLFRTVRPGREADFEAALVQRTAFLVEHDYPLPVEGFVVLAGAPGTALQAVFARDWLTFLETQSFGKFALALSDADREEYTRRKEAMLETMTSAEFYDAACLREASFGGR